MVAPPTPPFFFESSGFECRVLAPFFLIYLLIFFTLTPPTSTPHSFNSLTPSPRGTVTPHPTTSSSLPSSHLILPSIFPIYLPVECPALVQPPPFPFPRSVPDVVLMVRYIKINPFWAPGAGGVHPPPHNVTLRWGNGVKMRAQGSEINSIYHCRARSGLWLVQTPK